ncbi:hypothetical protein D3C77_512140 [compost metagenome]
MGDKQREFLDLRSSGDNFLPPVVGRTCRGTYCYRGSKAEAGKYRVVEIAIGRIAELFPAQGSETGHRAKRPGEVNLGGIVGFAGAQALVFVRGRKFDLTDQIHQYAALTAVEQRITCAGDRIAQAAFHIPATARQRIAIRPDFRVGDAQPGHGDFVSHGAGFVLAHHWHVPDFRGGPGAIVTA